MQDVAHKAVVVHRKWATMQQMRQDRLVRRVKMSMYNKKKSAKDSFDLYPKKNQRKKLILLKMRYGIDIFYK